MPAKKSPWQAQHPDCQKAVDACQRAVDEIKRAEQAKTEELRAIYERGVKRQEAATREAVEAVRAEKDRLEAIVKSTWRFWASTQESAIEPVLDRGYVTIRVRADKWAEFDALFRTSRGLSDYDG